MEPDYQALARAWVDGDPRSCDLARTDPEGAARLTARLAEALERRRREVSTEKGDLVIHVDRSRFVAGAGLDAEALEEMAQHLQAYATGGDAEGE